MNVLILLVAVVIVAAGIVVLPLVYHSLKEQWKLSKQLADVGIFDEEYRGEICLDCDTTDCTEMKENNYDLCCLCHAAYELDSYCDACWDRHVDRELQDLG